MQRLGPVWFWPGTSWHRVASPDPVDSTGRAGMLFVGRRAHRRDVYGSVGQQAWAAQVRVVVAGRSADVLEKLHCALQLQGEAWQGMGKAWRGHSKASGCRRDKARDSH